MNEPVAASRDRWPLVMRLAGLWLIWSAFASSVGWILSWLGSLDGVGYVCASPILLSAWILWWRHTRPAITTPHRSLRTRRRGKRRWLLRCFQIVAGLSLLAAVSYLPWSMDSVTYRLPRCLYWMAQKHWYWIGTIDGRLDYSSCGMEWQIIPLLLLAKSDRCLFLLNYLPFLLLPGLIYLGGRTLGSSRKSLLIWMWLLPCAYCIALQCSGTQNDGYSVTYTVACLTFCGRAINRRDPRACALAGCAASLLTGAKLSNLPLMLPLGALFLLAARKSDFFKKPIATALLVMLLVSFLPLAVLSYSNTGDWTGDPKDQWGFRTGNPVAATVANLVIAANDLIYPPVVPFPTLLNKWIAQAEVGVTPLLDWLKASHHMFSGVKFGNLVYEGVAGAGFSIGSFLLGGVILGGFSKKKVALRPIDRWQSLVLIGGVCAWFVLLAKLGSNHSPRNTAPYLPLLVFALSRSSLFSRFLHSKSANGLAVFGMLSVIPIILLTPARPMFPLSWIDHADPSNRFSGVLSRYKTWATLRDDLQPMREQLPQTETVIGFAGAFQDTSYGLWKPFGSRQIREIGVPLGQPSRFPRVPNYVVATKPGIQNRFGETFDQWLKKEHKQIFFTFKRATSLEADDGARPEDWFLLGPATNIDAR